MPHAQPHDQSVVRTPARGTWVPGAVAATISCANENPATPLGGIGGVDMNATQPRKSGCAYVKAALRDYSYHANGIIMHVKGTLLTRCYYIHQHLGKWEGHSYSNNCVFVAACLPKLIRIRATRARRARTRVTGWVTGRP